MRQTDPERGIIVQKVFKKEVKKDIPETGNPLRSEIDVSGGLFVEKILVTVDIEHSASKSDLSIVLIDPKGDRVKLFTNDENATGGTFNEVIFDDAATKSIEDAVQIATKDTKDPTSTEKRFQFTGPHRPTELLSSLAQQVADGTWILEVQDNVEEDIGKLESWSIRFEVKDPALQAAEQRTEDAEDKLKTANKNLDAEKQRAEDAEDKLKTADKNLDAEKKRAAAAEANLKQANDDLAKLRKVADDLANAPPEMDVYVKLPDEIGVYDFGDVEVGMPSDRVIVTIDNPGGKALELTGDPKVALEGETGHFKVACDPQSPVGGQSSTAFAVTFQPATGGRKTAKAVVKNSLTPADPYEIELRGRGIGPEINVIQDDTNIQTVSGEVDFGAQKPGTTSDEMSFTIENLGLGDLQLTGKPKVQVSGKNSAEFDVKSQPSAMVSPGDSTKFHLRFKPTSEGDKRAEVTIDNNDADESSYTFKVKGLGGTAGIEGTISGTLEPTEEVPTVAPELFSAGATHFLLVNPSDGRLYAFGWNNYGEAAGTGGSKDNHYQGLVGGLEGAEIVAAAAGRFFSLALDKNGCLWRWGNNYYYQLGDGTNSMNENPRKFPASAFDGKKIVSVAAGSEHALALDEAGNVWQWGRPWSKGYKFQRSNSSCEAVKRPARVKGSNLPKFTLISAGHNSSFAVDDAGIVWAWGDQYQGRLGKRT